VRPFYHVNQKGYHVNQKGYHVNQKGYHVNQKGYHVNQKGWQPPVGASDHWSIPRRARSVTPQGCGGCGSAAASDERRQFDNQTRTA